MPHRARLLRAPRLARVVLPLVAFPLLAACEPELPANSPAASPQPAPASSGVLPSAPNGVLPAASSAAPEAASKPYSGHGLGSVSPEILEKFAPTPLGPSVSRRVQAMFDVRAPGAGVLSPDGKTMYFGWTITGTRQLWRLDGPQRFPVQLTGGEDSTTIVDITPDGRHLIVARDQKGEENPGLYIQDPKGGALQVIQHKPGIQTSLQHVTDDSRAVYYRSNDIKQASYAIYRYDIEKKQRELVFDQEGIWSIEDVRPDGRLLLAKEVGSNMAELFEWNPASKSLTPLFGQGEREDYQAEYGPGEGEVIVLTPKLGEFRRLYLWKAGKLTPIGPELKFDVASFSLDRKKQRIFYEVNEAGYMRFRAMDAKTYRDIKLPAFPPSDRVAMSATTPSGAFSTFSVDTGKGPPTSYVYEWATGKLTAWHTPSSPEMDPARFGRATLESYPARDGTKIPMFVSRPASCQKPCPVVVEFHGGPEGQAQAGFNSRAQIFNDAGFVFVQPNVRGSDGYGKAWLHADDGPKRLAVITDIEDCSIYLRKAWAEDGQAPKLGIAGGSYGGYSSLVGMTMFAGAYDAGAEIVGFSNLTTFLQNTAPYRRPLRISEYGDPDKDREALAKLSPINYLERVKGPLLLMQGANDPRVPVGEAVQIYTELAARKLPAKLMIFADEGHGAAKRENQVLMVGHMVRFFEEHLQGKKPS